VTVQRLVGQHILIFSPLSVQCLGLETDQPPSMYPMPGAGRDWSWTWVRIDQSSVSGQRRGRESCFKHGRTGVPRPYSEFSSPSPHLPTNRFTRWAELCPRSRGHAAANYFQYQRHDDYRDSGSRRWQWRSQHHATIFGSDEDHQNMNGGMTT